MDIKVEISPKEITAKVETPNEPIYGGTKDYTKLDNLPSINGSVIIGDMTLLQLGIQPQGDYAERSELPVNVSELNNDAGYLVQSDLSDYAKTENIPTKVSELENDSDYATKSDLPKKTSQLLNDSNLAYVTDIPTKTSELENDSNFAYVSDIPTKFSELENDSLKNVDNTSDENKPVSIAQRKAIDDAYANSNKYTDQKIADLIGGAPETLDTLKEVADAIAESKNVEEALNSAIGTKASQAELDTHTGNDTIHIIADERTAWTNKYDKPTNGIPKSDLSNEVQTSLGKADTALQKHQDISGLATKTELENHATANTIAFDEINNNLSGISNAVAEKIESEVATDFSQADTPEFQQTIDDITDSVSELKGDLDELEKFIGVEYEVQGNLWDYSHAAFGYFKNGSGVLVEETGGVWRYSPTYIPMKKGEIIKCDNSKPLVALYDRGAKLIRGFQLTAPYTVEFDGFIRFSVLGSSYGNVVVYKGNYKPPYNYFTNVYQKFENTKRDIVVSKKGGGDYTSLVEAVHETEGDIYVKAGTYDVVAEYNEFFGSDFLENCTFTEDESKHFQGGIYVENRKIEFESGAVIRCVFPYYNRAIKRFSLFWLGENAIIDGLVCENVSNVYYIIHDDTFNDSGSYTNIIRNSVIDGTVTQTNVIGGGCSAQCTNIVENCYLSNRVDNSVTLRYHNDNVADASPKVIIRNCYVNGDVNFNWYGSQTTKMKCYAYGNEVCGNITKQAEDSTKFNVDNIDMYTWNNKTTN